VAYALTANPWSQQRIGEIYIAGRPLLITQASDPIIVTQPTNQIVPPGGTAVFNVEVAGTAPFTYQWYFGSVPLVDGNGISGATTSTLTLTDVQTSQAGGYWVTVSNSLRGWFSSTASLTVSCSYSLFPHTATFSSISNTDFIVVNGNTDCPWNFVNTNSWVTILSGVTNIGNGTIVYSVAENPTTNARTGRLSIADQTFIIYQSGSAPINATVSLAEALDTVGTLAWGTSGTPAWFGQSSVSHDGADTAQSGPIGNSAAVTVQTTVNGPGTISFWWKVSSQENKDYLKFFINGVQQIRISGEVDWQIRSLPITSTTNILKWTYSKSPYDAEGLDRGWLDQVRFIPGTGCVVTLPQTSVTNSGISETGQVSVTAATGCTWAVDNTNLWITPLVDVGEGDGYFRYSVAANTSTASRSGILTIGGQPLTIVQLGAPCTLSILRPSRTFDYQGGSGGIDIITPTGCPWSPVNTNDWVTIIRVSGPSGSGGIDYLVASNNTLFPRSGNIRVGDQLYSISQAAAPIPLPEALDTVGTSLDWFYGSSVGVTENWKGQSAVTHDGVDALQSGDVIPNGSSPFGAVSYFGTYAWVPGTLTFWWKVSSGSTNGGLHFQIDDVEQIAIFNEVDWQQRTFTIPAGRHMFQWRYVDTTPDGGHGHGWVDQVQFTPAPGCALALTQDHVPFLGTYVYTNHFDVITAGNCAWNAINTNPWITILSGGNGFGNSSSNYTVSTRLTYAVDVNPTASARSGYIRISDQSFLITQAGNPSAPGNTNAPAGCTYSISPGSRAHGYAGGTGIVAVATQTGCAWNVLTTNSWISILSTLNSSNSGTFTYSLAPNTNSQTRSGNVLIGGQRFLLTQAGTSSGTNALRLEFMGRTGTNATLSVHGESGKMYVVQCSEDLIHWTPIGTNSAPSTVTDAAAANAPQRFYRTVEIP
jgi:hypothetical protein